jgi:sulfotransferase family protein
MSEPLTLPDVLEGEALDPADEAMSIRAWDRYRAPRRNALRRRRKRNAALPNLIIIGGLKCGTTSFHHYLGLHPEIQMSKPKELSFFVSELNWRLGLDWYASRFDRHFPVRGESSPHYTNLPRFSGVAERMHQSCPDARLIYMVRDPIERLLSHWLQNCGAGYETREMVPTLSDPESPYVCRSKYWMQLQPFLEFYDSSQIEIFTQEEMKSEREETMRRAFRFLGVGENFASDQFSREWERTGAKAGSKYRFLNSAVRLPVFREFDERFDRLPESLRWLVERIVHDPGRPSPPKPELPPDLIETLRGWFAEDVNALQDFAGREFVGWRSY